MRCFDLKGRLVKTSKPPSYEVVDCKSLKTTFHQVAHVFSFIIVLSKIEGVAPKLFLYFLDLHMDFKKRLHGTCGCQNPTPSPAPAHALDDADWDYARNA